MPRAITWLPPDVQIGLVLLGVGGVVLVMLAGLIWAMSRWGE